MGALVLQNTIGITDRELQTWECPTERMLPLERIPTIVSGNKTISPIFVCHWWSGQDIGVFVLRHALNSALGMVLFRKTPRCVML